HDDGTQNHIERDGGGGFGWGREEGEGGSLQAVTSFATKPHILEKREGDKERERQRERLQMERWRYCMYVLIETEREREGGRKMEKSSQFIYKGAPLPWNLAKEYPC